MADLKKGCELCSNPARMLCDSDQASLCWDCDQKVHAANFLVAKHSRTLLCHVCQSPTPWCAAGPNLGRTVSVCHACAHRPNNDGEIYSDDDDDDDDDEEEEEEEDGENQVVPWSESNSCSPAPPLTAATSSFSEDENVSTSSSKRSRSNSESEDEDGSWSSPNQNSNENYSCSLGLLRPLKMRRSDGDCEGGTAAIVEKLQRF